MKNDVRISQFFYFIISKQVYTLLRSQTILSNEIVISDPIGGKNVRFFQRRIEACAPQYLKLNSIGGSPTVERYLVCCEDNHTANNPIIVAFKSHLHAGITSALRNPNYIFGGPLQPSLLV